MAHYNEYYELQSGGGGGISRVFAGSRYQRGHGIGSFLGGLFRRVFPYLASGARAIGKEALRAGVKILDDVSDNKIPLKEAVKNRVVESRDNLKRRAKEKIVSLMQGSGYISSAKRRPGQFVPGELSSHITDFKKTRRRRRKIGKKSSNGTSRRKGNEKKKRRGVIKQSTSKKKKKSSRKTSAANRRRRSKKRTVSDIFA